MKRLKNKMVFMVILVLLTGCGRAPMDLQGPTSSKEEAEISPAIKTTEPEDTPTETVSAEPVISETPENSIFSTDDFTLILPENWDGKYVAEELEDEECATSYIAFYEKECNKEIEAGWLFTIGRFPDKSYEEQPSYEVIGQWNDIIYVALFPTDVQCDGVSEKAQKQYFELAESVEDVVTSIRQVQ